MFDLKGKKALVTGGNSGIGFGIAKALVQSGVTVIIVGKDNKKNKNALFELKKINDACDAFQFDLQNYRKIPEFFKNLIVKFDAFDILINCAGITIRKRADLLSIDEWEKIIAVNLTSCFVLTTQWARSLIKKNQSGSCVIVLSLMSEVARPTTSAYGASKAALKQLVRSFAVDWGKFNIRINGISPGYIKTELTEPLYNDSEFSNWIIKRTPLGRWGTPEDIGPLAVFLCSDEASFITGHTVFVDGGFLASL
ncbi:MAG: SDR family NAD(P)-dependent oxidoreductase [Candidatus Ratteibacteria bacterium]